jgi:hypothetical protein
MKYNINIVPLTKSNLEKFTDTNYNRNKYIIEKFSNNFQNDPYENYNNNAIANYLKNNNLETIAYGLGKQRSADDGMTDKDRYNKFAIKHFTSLVDNKTLTQKQVEIHAGSITNNNLEDSQDYSNKSWDILSNNENKPFNMGSSNAMGFLMRHKPRVFHKCEDGWDMGSHSCSTVSTDMIHTTMSIWKDFNSNECDIFGNNQFDTMVSRNYPEGRYYCDNSLHGIQRAFTEGKHDADGTNIQNSPRGLSRACVGVTPKEKKRCQSNPEQCNTGESTSGKLIENIEDNILGIQGFAQHPGGIYHQTNPDGDEQGSHKDFKSNGNKILPKLSVNFTKTCFSNVQQDKNKNFPVPPIVQWNGEVPPAGMMPAGKTQQFGYNPKAPHKQSYTFCDNDDNWNCPPGSNPCRYEGMGNKNACINNPLCYWKENDKAEIKCRPKFDTKKPVSSSPYNETGYEVINKRDKRYMLFCDALGETEQNNAECLDNREINPCICGNEYFNSNENLAINRKCTKEECGKKKMCQFESESNECKPISEYKLNKPASCAAESCPAGYYDSNSHKVESRFKYKIDDTGKANEDNGEEKKHQKKDQYAKYIDCLRHGLNMDECYNESYKMTQLGKWCDALELGGGYESWNDSDFGQDYRYNISNLDLIPTDFTDKLEIYNDEDTGEQISRFSVPWINNALPQPLNTTNHKAQFFYAGQHGSTDAIPGGNEYYGNNLNSSSEKDKLLFLNRGYCPTRMKELGSFRYSTRGDDEYIHFKNRTAGPWPLRIYNTARDITNANFPKDEDVCNHLNDRHMKHKAALGRWKEEHDIYHKVTPSIQLVSGASLMNTSKCTLNTINSSINRIELCRTYGIGGIDHGQVYFTNPKYMVDPVSDRCKLAGDMNRCGKNPNCKLEDDDDGNQKCISKFKKEFKQKHGDHLFGKCTSRVILDFQNICRSLNIPLFVNETNKFSLYKCNARDVIRKIKKCTKLNYNLAAGEICNVERVNDTSAATRNQGMVYQNSRDSWYLGVLTSKQTQLQEKQKKLDILHTKELDLQVEQETSLIEEAAKFAEIEVEYRRAINQSDQKETYIKDYNDIVLCKKWNDEYSKKLEDPWNQGRSIAGNKTKIEEYNTKCNKYIIPFPKNIIMIFGGIILVILIYLVLTT